MRKRIDLTCALVNSTSEFNRWTTKRYNWLIPVPLKRRRMMEPAVCQPMPVLVVLLDTETPLTHVLHFLERVGLCRAQSLLRQIVPRCVHVHVQIAANGLYLGDKNYFLIVFDSLGCLSSEVGRYTATILHSLGRSFSIK